MKCLNKLFAFICLSCAVIFITGCNDANEVAGSIVSQEAVAESNTDPAGVFSADEIAKHNTKDDCWMIIDGKVYDLSSYVNMHPGGSKIVEGCGIDATELYNTKSMDPGVPHSEKATSMLEKYYIGNQI